MVSSFDGIIFILEIVGTVAFAVSGVITAIEKDLDLLGVLVLGTVTAVGGGALRDILLGILPPVLFRNPIYVLVAAVISLFVFIIAYYSKFGTLRQQRNQQNIINILDAVGLGVFVVVGVRAAIKAGFGNNFFLSVFVGTVTGIGGGLMRDQLAGLIPMVLRKRIYAIAALSGAILYYCLNIIGISEVISAFSGICIIILIRLLATKFRWDLPHIPKK